jgi:hypothetical protein
LEAAHTAGFVQVIGWAGSVPRLLGVIYRSLGRYGEAETWLQFAITQADLGDARAELARAQLNLAELLVAQGDDRAAAAAAGQAAVAFRDLGLVALLDRCNRLRLADSDVHRRS